MLYSEAIEYLYQLRLTGTKLGLENTFKLSAIAGNPHQRLRFIHVAGTNGKGSTCAMLESIYRTAGLKVGLFTSPHLVKFSERIQINRQLISEEDVVRLVDRMREWIASFPESSQPTFFEAITVMALVYFAKQQCDLVIWETGLGGRLDATNIVMPLASVITNIQLDHQKWLGETLEQIAFEKAGIIKPGAPVITAEDKPGPVQVIAQVAKERGAPLVRVTPEDAKRLAKEGVRIALQGEHQFTNAALAMATVHQLSDKLPVSERAVRDGLLATHWTGRFQVLHVGAGRTIVIDGAHNPAGVETLRNGLQQLFPGTLATLIFGVMGDKDWAAMCRILMPLAGRILLSPVSSQRTADPELLARLCKELNPYAEVVAFNSLEQALRQTVNDPLVVITGSLHFIGEAIELLNVSPVPAISERGLNEWVNSPGR